MTIRLPLDQVLEADSCTALYDLPEASVDLIFADPPYNLQLRGDLYRPNLSRVDAVDDSWDQFDSFKEYDEFTRTWLQGCRRALKPTGTLWVIGSYHNIYRVGSILMDLGYWILNDVAWVKSNPMPNFRGVRFTNAHESLIWARRSADQKRYTFHYKLAKALNGGKQMRSDWRLSLCTGGERLRVDGQKAHTTQKPEALLERIIRLCSSRGDVVLDPFFGTGTTGAICRRFGRHFIGIEKNATYAALARERIAGVPTLPPDEMEVEHTAPAPARLPFTELLRRGLLEAGQELRFGRTDICAQIQADGSLRLGEASGSIHRMGALAAGAAACNGWEHWCFQDGTTGDYYPIDRLRQSIRAAESSGEDAN